MLSCSLLYGWGRWHQRYMFLDLSLSLHSLRNQCFRQAHFGDPVAWCATRPDPWRKEERDEETLQGGCVYSSDVMFVSFYEIYLWHADEHFHGGASSNCLWRAGIFPRGNVNVPSSGGWDQCAVKDHVRLPHFFFWIRINGSLVLIIAMLSHHFHLIGRGARLVECTSSLDS